MQNETIKLHPAYTWDCPECGHINFVFITRHDVMEAKTEEMAINDPDY